MATHRAMALPRQQDFHNPTLRALTNLGGVGRIREISDEVAALMSLSPEQRGIPHKQDHLMYVNRVKWSIHRLYRIGMLRKPQRGVYALTELGHAGIDVDPRRIEQMFRDLKKQEKVQTVELSHIDSDYTDELLPDYKTMIGPALQALRELGGRARKGQISDLVAEKLGLSNEQINVATASGASYFGLRMDSVRRYFLNEDLISNPQLGTWELTQKGWLTESIDVATSAPARKRRRRETSLELPQARNEPVIPLEVLIAEYRSWQEELFSLLYTLPPEVFERLFSLIFSAEGVDQVEVVNYSRDSEVEGTMTSDGFLSFRVYFKFSRDAKLIDAREVDDFRRSAQASRADKGLLITTGKFTQEATRAASRAAPNIELIDGEQFIAKLKERELGVKSERLLVEHITIDPDFFASI